MTAINKSRAEIVDAGQYASDMIKYLYKLINTLKAVNTDDIKGIDMSDIKDLIYIPGEIDKLSMHLKRNCAEIHDELVKHQTPADNPLNPIKDENTIISV